MKETDRQTYTINQFLICLHRLFLIISQRNNTLSCHECTFITHFERASTKSITTTHIESECWCVSVFVCVYACGVLYMNWWMNVMLQVCVRGRVCLSVYDYAYSPVRWFVYTCMSVYTSVILFFLFFCLYEYWTGVWSIVSYALCVMPTTYCSLLNSLIALKESSTRMDTCSEAPY